jgi:hypothetical protein
MTPPFVVAPVVEGQGEVAAVPLLVRRLTAEIDPDRPVEVRRPIRVARSKVTKPGELERHVALAAVSAGPAGAVLVILDADDDCPAKLGPELLGRSSGTHPDLPVAVVFAMREFESWFLAAAHSLRSKRGLPHDLDPPPDPEAKRDAKGWLQEHRVDGFAYSPTTDQPALAASMDLAAARAGAPSFDKLWRDIERLMGITQGSATA